MQRIVPELAATAALCLLVTGCSLLPTSPVIPGEGAARLRALHSAAEQDNGLAQAQLAVLYFEGAPGVGRDLERAHYWFLKAADHGCSASQLHLGLMHLSGEYLAQDLDLATHWFRQAAEHDRAAIHQRLIQVHSNDLPLRLRVAYEWIRDPRGGPPEELSDGSEP